MPHDPLPGSAAWSSAEQDKFLSEFTARTNIRPRHAAVYPGSLTPTGEPMIMAVSMTWDEFVAVASKIMEGK